MKKRTKNTKQIIDVRRPDEFKSGHAEGSINIPLSEIENYLDEIKKMANPVLVCGGGTRHVKAFELLKQKGIETEKGGSWKDIGGEMHQ